MAISIAKNIDCMIELQYTPDKFYDLAIVDPPYGIGAGNGFGRSLRENIKVKKGNWDDSPPPPEYFTELFRVSQNQIIWGGNYFILPPTRGFVIWDKVNAGRDFADCEFAWTSFDTVARIVKYRVATESNDRIHPTQKPVRLYEWLLKNYAKPGDKILDTHLGSGSSRIAARNLGFDFWGYEIDGGYYNDQEQRFNKGFNTTLFDLK
jgi:site-specific DNA-methyltransferase (adenine-specific)